MFRGVILLFNQLFELAKIFFIMSLVCFAPQILFRKHNKPVSSLLRDTKGGIFRLGIDNVTAQYVTQVCSDALPHIGLITHNKAKSVSLLQKKEIEVSKLFYPSYGYFEQDAVEQKDDAASSIASYVVKDDDFGGQLHDLNLLLVDLQDIGLGSISSVSLLFRALSASVKYAIPVVILDRPNILGNKIEGSLLLSEDQFSARIPLRYGMTVAELAQYYNTHILGKKARLHIVPMHNYDRVEHSVDIDVPGLSKVTDVDTAWGFSVCGILLHVSPFDVGLDTKHSYRCIALPRSVAVPDQKWYQLQVTLRHLGVDSSIYRYYSKRKKEACRGLRLHIKDINTVDSFKILLTILEFFKRSGVILHFSDYFDQAVGSSLVRKYIQGRVSRQVLAHTINHDLEKFYRKAFGAFMYHPVPQVVLV